MLKKLFASLGILISLPLFASRLTVGIESNAETILSQDKYVSLISCLISRPNLIVEVEKLPANRLASAIQKGLIAAAFPARQTKQADSFNLPPISVDELVLITRPKKPVQSIGILRGGDSLYAPFIEARGQQLQLESVDTASLIKALELNHVDGIYLEKQQIPGNFKLSDYQLHTVYYLPHQIQLNSLFFKLTGLKRQEVIKRANFCFKPRPYIISPQSREQLFRKISPLIGSLQKAILVAPTSFKNLNTLEKKWAIDKQFRRQILASRYSVALKKFLIDSPFVIEALIYNHQGGLLGSNTLPSDFDQSDEDKFTRVKDNKNFSLGNVSDILYDLSSNRFLVEITARLYDAQKNYAGGISLGIDINSYLLK